jgi:hypothetical protein
MACFFDMPIVPAGSFNKSLNQTGNSFLHPEYFSAITVNNKVLSNDPYPFNIRKSCLYIALESNTNRTLNAGTSVAIIILT